MAVMAFALILAIQGVLGVVEKFKGDGKKPPKDSSEPVTGDAGTSGGEDKVEAVDGSKEASSSSVESKAKSNNPPASSASSND